MATSDDTVIDTPSTELHLLRSLEVVVREYFYFADNATAHGKTKEEFMYACELSRLAREKIRVVLNELMS